MKNFIISLLLISFTATEVYSASGASSCSVCHFKCTESGCPDRSARNPLECSGCHVKCLQSNCSADTSLGVQEVYDPYECEVSKWSSWSACSHKCGSGTKKRSRSIDWKVSGAKCPSLHDETKCNAGSCNCAVGWSKHNEHCYSIVTLLQSFSSSLSYCGGQGGYLVIPDSADEVKFINSLMKGRTSPSSYWVGLQKHGSVWYKSDGKSTIYDNILPWYPGQSQYSVSYGASYVHARLQTDAKTGLTFLRDDKADSSKYGSICEKNASS